MNGPSENSRTAPKIIRAVLQEGTWFLRFITQGTRVTYLQIILSA